jgi:hypothetical protein
VFSFISIAIIGFFGNGIFLYFRYEVHLSVVRL